jgi:spore germination cell wall hydrolase CwlJ-like protein
MKTLTKLMIAANVAIAGSMVGLFYVHTQEENKRFEELKESMSQQIDSLVYELHAEQKLSVEMNLIDITTEVAKKMEEVKQHQCLALNVYHEARSEGLTGQRAIAWVTLNRVESPKYPDTICKVVYQARLDENNMPLRNKCSFSWYCDGKSDEVADLAAWNVASDIAYEVMDAYGKETDPTNGSIMYHADYVMPYWVSAYEKQVRIDSHIFYN